MHGRVLVFHDWYPERAWRERHARHPELVYRARDRARALVSSLARSLGTAIGCGHVSSRQEAVLTTPATV